MSRSYKKTPITKGCGYGRFGKKYANRILRRNNETFKRSLYKRNFNSWDINDYINYFSLEDAENYYNQHKDEDWFNRRFKTLDDYINNWKKYYRRK